MAQFADRGGIEGQAADYLKFLSENPDWPSREQLQRRMEETLFEEGGDTDVIATYFTGREARSPAGMAVLASVHVAHGETEQAKALAVKIWRDLTRSAFSVPSAGGASGPPGRPGCSFASENRASSFDAGCWAGRCASCSLPGAD